MATRGKASRFRFRLLPSVLLTAAILLIPAALYAWGRQADSFAVERVKVSGTRRIPEKQALRLLRKEFEGRNLFTVTGADVRATLDRLCYLAAVEIDRDFPTTLRVRVIEHRPLLYVLANGRWFLLADSGHVICTVGAEDGAAGQSAAPSPASSPTTSAAPTATTSTTPAPTTSATGDAASADRNDGASPGVEEASGGSDAAVAAAVAAALEKGPPKMKPRLPRMAGSATPKAGATIRDDEVRLGLRVLVALPTSLRARVRVLSVDDEAQVSLDLEGGPVVRLGGDERMRAKVLSLRAVLAAYRRAGKAPTAIDVSAPDRPLAQPRLTS
jgi:cell division septal protein FtsQ